MASNRTSPSMPSVGDLLRQIQGTTDTTYGGSPSSVSYNEQNWLPERYFSQDPFLSSYDELRRLEDQSGSTLGESLMTKKRLIDKARHVLKLREEDMLWSTAFKWQKEIKDLLTPFRQEAEANRQADRQYRLQRDKLNSDIEQKNKLRQFIMGLFGGGKTGKLGDYSSVSGFWG